jgi:hypothetical protein
VTVSVGSLDHTFMSPREVFRDALLANAARWCSPTTTRPATRSPPATTSSSPAGSSVPASWSASGCSTTSSSVATRWVSLARRGRRLSRPPAMSAVSGSAPRWRRGDGPMMRSAATPVPSTPDPAPSSVIRWRSARREQPVDAPVSSSSAKP